MRLTFTKQIGKIIRSYLDPIPAGVSHIIKPVVLRYMKAVRFVKHKKRIVVCSPGVDCETIQVFFHPGKIGLIAVVMGLAAVGVECIVTYCILSFSNNLVTD